MISVTAMAAGLRACYSPSSGAQVNAEIRPVDTTNARELAISHHLESAWLQVDSTTKPKILIVESQAINAASMGQGRFLLWRRLTDLPEPELDAVISHEIAHDILGHSKKMGEVQDVADFISEAISTLSGSDQRSTRQINEWSRKAILPRFSQAQEVSADSEAVILMIERQLPGPVGSMCSMLRTLHSKAGVRDGGFFSSHPSTDERVRNLRRLFGTDSSVGACKLP